MTNAEARFNNSLRPRKPEGSLGRTAQDVHLDSHTAPELCSATPAGMDLYTLEGTYRVDFRRSSILSGSLALCVHMEDLLRVL